jgi:hypothetical protein
MNFIDSWIDSDSFASYETFTNHLNTVYSYSVFSSDVAVGNNPQIEKCS